MIVRGTAIGTANADVHGALVIETERATDPDVEAGLITRRVVETEAAMPPHREIMAIMAEEVAAEVAAGMVNRTLLLCLQ